MRLRDTGRPVFDDLQNSHIGKKGSFYSSLKHELLLQCVLYNFK